MKTTDWKFDFSSLPRWDNRERIPYVYDEFFEIPQSDALCCIYSIAEVSMCNYLGFLAILKNKEKPELLVNITDGFNLRPYLFSVSTDGNLIFLQASIHDRRTNSYEEPILIIDISEKRFAFVITGCFALNCKIVEIERGLFRIVADERQAQDDDRIKALDGSQIRIDSLQWYDLSKLRSLPEILRKAAKHPFRAFLKALTNWI